MARGPRILLPVSIGLLLIGGAIWFVLFRSDAGEVRNEAAAPAEPAAAPGPELAGHEIRASCRQGECHWLRVLRVETVRTVPEGALIRLVALEGSSTLDEDRARVRWEAGERESFAFCSRRRPAYAFRSDEALIVHYLDPFALAGYQLASATTYFRLCHGVEFEDGMESALRALGYRPGTRSEQVEGGSPEELARF